MGLRALPLQHNAGFISTTKVPIYRTSPRISRNPRWVVVSAKQGKDEEKKKKEEETSLFTRLTDALDFAQVRSEKDAELLYEAREATKSGGKIKEDNTLFQKTEVNQMSNKAETESRPTKSLPQLKPNSSPAIKHLYNGHHKLLVELAKRETTKKLSYVLQNRFDPLQVLAGADKTNLCRVSMV
ncbi:hypothetical protein Bca101_045502 [Brassica carinata]